MSTREDEQPTSSADLPSGDGVEAGAEAAAAPGWSPHTVLLIGALFSLAAAVLVSAWVSDDALISLRTIDHFLHGRGLRFNALERVQAFTHPLWLFVVMPFQALTGEGLWAPVIASLICTAGAVWLLMLRSGPGGAGPWVAVLALVSSKSFVDYSTSGLENPLTHLLLAAFGFYLLADLGEREPYCRRRVALLALITGLVFTNRMDAVLLVAPSVIWIAWRVIRARRLPAVVPAVLLGIAPALLWLVFAWLYFGSPFPNTAFSKLSTGIERGALVSQGLVYLQVFGALDLAGALVLVAGLVAGFSSARAEVRALAIGAVVYVVYTVWIGGDFMAGRFLAAPIFVSALILGHAAHSADAWWPRFAQAIAIAAVLLSAVSVDSPLRASNTDTYARVDPRGGMPAHGVVDERLWYYPSTGLFSAHRTEGLVPGGACDGEPELTVRDVCGALGETGFEGCAFDHWVDPCALSDAFLARRPVPTGGGWRIGHFKRVVPRGYRESIAAGRAMLGDPLLDAEFERTLLRVRSPIFDPDRLREIVRHPLGGPVGD